MSSVAVRYRIIEPEFSISQFRQYTKFPPESVLDIFAMTDKTFSLGLGEGIPPSCLRASRRNENVAEGFERAMRSWSGATAKRSLTASYLLTEQKKRGKLIDKLS